MPWRDGLRVFGRGIWALGLPVVLLGGIYGGIFTPTEAAAMSVVYALVVELVVYRDLSLTDIRKIATSAAITTASTKKGMAISVVWLMPPTIFWP